MSIKEWDKLMNSIDKELEAIHEALLDKEDFNAVNIGYDAFATVTWCIKPGYAS